MGKLENLDIITDSQRAKELQKKSVEKRAENKIKRRLIEEAIRKQLTDEDLQEIARNLINRSKKNSNDLSFIRDTIGEKPTDKVEANLTANIEIDIDDE